ncbi:hypothetical protein EV126DRAFT_412359 [Verticillium dahliae]|nr:hypothetical protein EV126DRAFT_412359 [Verticillium dahliae]
MRGCLVAGITLLTRFVVASCGRRNVGRMRHRPRGQPLPSSLMLLVVICREFRKQMASRAGSWMLGGLGLAWGYPSFRPRFRGFFSVRLTFVPPPPAWAFI